MSAASSPFLDPVAETAFLRAVHADLRSPAPRLIYADWLDERGDPRAEYLRLQCRLADPRERDDPAIREAVLEELQARERDLSTDWLSMLDAADRHTASWSPHAPEHVVFQSSGVRRGLTLRWVVGESIGRRPTRPRKLHAGDYVYPLRLERGKVVLVGRMRIAHVFSGLDLDRAWAAGPRVARFAFEEGRDLLEGDRGTRWGEVAAPRGVLERWRFADEEGERALDLVAGRIARKKDLRGVRRLTRATAFDLDCLLAGVDPG